MRSVAVRRLATAPRGDGRLRGGSPSHGDTEGRARPVVAVGLVAEGDGGRVAAVLAADADLEIGTHLAAALGADAHEFAYALLVDGDEWVGREDGPVGVVGEDRRGIVARKAKARLGEVVGAEREEL